MKKRRRYFQYFIFILLSFFYFFKIQCKNIFFSKFFIICSYEARAEKTLGSPPNRPSNQKTLPPPSSLPSPARSSGPPPPPSLPPPPSSPEVQNMGPNQSRGVVLEGDEVSQENEIVKEKNILLPTSEVQFLLEPFIYDASLDRRDPFVSYEIKPVESVVVVKDKIEPVSPLRQFDLSQFSLKGVLWDVKRPLAMFEDPRRVTHFVAAQDPIGNKNGYVAAIREGEVLVVEYSLVRGVKKSEVKRIVLDSIGENQGGRSSNFLSR